MWKSLKQSFESPDSYVSLALGLAVVLVVGMITMNYFKSVKTQTEMDAQKKAEISEKAASLPMKYKVEEGDTLWSISEKFYKSGYNWVDIAKANALQNVGYIEKGQELLIPEAKALVQATGQVSSATTEKKQYTVVHGDSLWSIAMKQYNDGYKWVEIAKANNLTNPNIIFAGNVLMLP